MLRAPQGLVYIREAGISTSHRPTALEDNTHPDFDLSSIPEFPEGARVTLGWRAGMIVAVEKVRPQSFDALDKAYRKRLDKGLNLYRTGSPGIAGFHARQVSVQAMQVARNDALKAAYEAFRSVVDARRNPPDLAPISASNWHRAFSLRGVNWDLKHGVGSIGYQGNSKYMGFMALLSVESFLALALPIDRRGKSIRWLMEQMQSGTALGPPYLEFETPTPGAPLQTIGHEGRHRTTVFREWQRENDYRAPWIVPVSCQIRSTRAHTYTFDDIEGWFAQRVAREQRGAFGGGHHTPRWYALFKGDEVRLADGVRLS